MKFSLAFLTVLFAHSFNATAAPLTLNVLENGSVVEHVVESDEVEDYDPSTDVWTYVGCADVKSECGPLARSEGYDTAKPVYEHSTCKNTKYTCYGK